MERRAFSDGGKVLRFQCRPSGYGRRVALEFLVNGSSVGVTKLKGVVLVVVLSRLLGLGAYGVWIQFMVIIELSSSICGLGLQNALVRYFPHMSREQRRDLTWTSYAMIACVSCIVMGVLVMFADDVAAVLGGEQSDGAVFVLISSAVPALALRLPALNLWRACDQLHRYSVASSLVDLFELGGVVSGILFARSLYGAAIGYVVILWLEVLVLLVLTRNRFGGPSVAVEHIKVLRYSLPLVPAALSAGTLGRADRLVIGAMLGPVQVGIYSAVYAVASVLNLIGLAFTNVLFPKVVRDPAGATRLVSRYSGLFLLIGVPVLGLVTFVSGPVVRSLTGAEISAGRAALLVGAVGLGVLFFAWGGVRGLPLYAQDRTLMVWCILFTSALVNLGMNYLLIPRFGLLGAALATTGAFVYYAAVQSWCLNQCAAPVIALGPADSASVG